MSAENVISPIDWDKGSHAAPPLPQSIHQSILLASLEDSAFLANDSVVAGHGI